MATKNSAAFGLDAIGQEAETARMTIFHPATDEPLLDDDGNEMWIEVYGLDSAHYRQVQNAQTNRRIQKAQRAGGRVNITAEQQEANALDLLVKCTKAWHVVLGGEVPACEEKKVRETYERFPWLREQVDTFMHERKNFLTN
jgi:hypothetical protein